MFSPWGKKKVSDSGSESQQEYLAHFIPGLNDDPSPALVLAKTAYFYVYC